MRVIQGVDGVIADTLSLSVATKTHTRPSRYLVSILFILIMYVHYHVTVNTNEASCMFLTGYDVIYDTLNAGDRIKPSRLYPEL